MGITHLTRIRNYLKKTKTWEKTSHIRDSTDSNYTATLEALKYLLNEEKSIEMKLEKMQRITYIFYRWKQNKKKV